MKIVLMVLSGLWGAWVGFGGFLHVKSNSDSFAMIFVLSYYVVFAGIGIIIGSLVAMSIWFLVEKIVRSVGVTPKLMPILASALTGIAVWLLTDLIYKNYPGLH